MKRAVLACAIAVGLAIGTVLPTSAIGLTQVTLSCDDGTSVPLVVDTDTLTSLTSSVQAMIDYPAGLTCTLVQIPLGLGAFLGHVAFASPGSNPFIVGGGRWQVPCEVVSPPPPPPPPCDPGIDPNCPCPPSDPTCHGGGSVEPPIVARVPGAWFSLTDPGAAPQPTSETESVWVNIAVNVHKQDSSATNGSPPFFGTLNETIPANQSCRGNPIGESHFTSKTTCLLPDPIDPTKAYVTSKVTQTSGAPFPAPSPSDTTASVTVDHYVHFGFWDNKNPPGQNPFGTPSTDMLNGAPASPEGSQDPPPPVCNPAEFDPIYHLGDLIGTKQYGNISIRNTP